MHSCPEFERMLVRSGIVLLKYWLSVSEDEQDCPPCDAFLKTYRKSGELAREVLSTRELPDELNDRVRAFLKTRLGLD